MGTQAQEPFASPAGWRGRELLQRDDWEVHLDEADEAELVRAVDSTRGMTLEALNRKAFELPTLAPRLSAVQHSLEDGSGATLVRGLTLDGLDEERRTRLFWGLARHVGSPVSQTAQGERLLHVRDEGFASEDPRFRGPHSAKRLSFHTDRCDVIAFLCIQPAREGGENHVISSVTLYNELLRRHPEELRVLMEPFPYLRHTVDPDNQRRFIRQPIFTRHDGGFAASFLRVLIDRADREPKAPDLTDEQRAALDVLEEVAEDPALYASFRLERGDVLLLNNWVTFHRRTAFEDHAQPDQRRHLLRLWLSVPNSRALDPCFADHFGATEGGALRGGIWPAERD